MKNRVFIAKNGVIQIDVVGDQTPESVRAIGREVMALVTALRIQNRRVLILDNLKELGKTDSATRHEVAVLANQLYYDRAVMVGDSNPVMRYGTNLMLKAIGRSNLRYFASFDAAWLWLNVPAPETIRERSQPKSRS